MSIYKIVLLGQSCVGKTSIADRFVRNIFIENNNSTIGASFLTKSIKLPNEDVKLDIWDTAGQERYESLATFYYRGADGIIIVYDITDMKSFYSAINWIQKLKEYFEQSLPIIYLVGNKSDLEKYRMVYPYHVYQELNEKFNDISIHYTEVSAKLSINIQPLFYELSTKIKSKYKRKEKEKEETVKITTENTRRRCCFY